MKSYYFIIILLLGLSRQLPLYNLKDLRPQAFTSREDAPFLEVDLNIGKDEVVIAYVDINNDKYTDLITYIIEDSQIAFYAEIYNHTSGFFNKTAPLFSINSSNIIRNLLVNSLEPKSQVDFILTISPKENPTQHNTIFFRETSSGTYQKHPFEIINSPIFIADLDGDRYLDILYYDEESHVRQVINFRLVSDPDILINQTDFELFFENEDYEHCTENNQFIGRRLDTNGGMAFIDVDGDCRNDLLITSLDENNEKVLEIWQGRVIGSQIKYCLGSKGVKNLDASYGSFGLGDFNNDGYIDLIFPIVMTTTVHIIQNQHTLSFDWTGNYCKEHPYNHTLYDMYDFSTENVIQIDLMKDKWKEEHFYQSPLISSTIIRIGNYNSEPMPGLITIIEDSSHKKMVRLYQSYLDNKKDDNKRITLSFKMTHSFDVPKAIYASFFDFDDNGQFDIIIVTEDNDSRTRGYYNNLQHDTFFIKAQTMLQKDQFYSIEVGTNYRFIATNNDGSRRMDFISQLPQTTNLALNPPYALTGIGRSNNYIENFQVISTVIDGDTTQDTQIFTPIIPNSQLIITKRQDDYNEVLWEIDLIVQPMSQLIILVIVVAVILFLLLILIIVLHCIERKADKKAEGNKFAAWY